VVVEERKGIDFKKKRQGFSLRENQAKCGVIAHVEFLEDFETHALNLKDDFLRKVRHSQNPFPLPEGFLAGRKISAEGSDFENGQRSGFFIVAPKTNNEFSSRNVLFDNHFLPGHLKKLKSGFPEGLVVMDHETPKLPSLVFSKTGFYKNREFKVLRPGSLGSPEEKGRCGDTKTPQGQLR
jgi:hypothetical protein